MRKRLTIRINDSLRQALAERAKSQGNSVSTLVREILEEAVAAQQPLKVGLNPASHRRQIHHDLDHLAGTWSQEEANEFLESIQSQP